MNPYQHKDPDYTPEEARLMKLIGSCKDVEVFECEGRLFLGNYIGAAKNFIKDNPEPADFYVWLQDHYKELKQ